MSLPPTETPAIKPERSWLAAIRSSSRLPVLLALLAALLYLYQSWGYAHSLQSVLDEGAYLYKGYAFASGQYQLYQDYGFWSNHMPLAFYIPGGIQTIFGPGLGTGRYFAIFLGALMLLGLWLVIRRLGGPWWAAVALLGIAINPAIVKMYSTAITQVLIACMLVWVLVLTLGKDRPLWQLALGAVLAAVMWMTRINLFPVLPILLLYILWQNGLKAALIAGLAGGLTLVLLHVPFWPGILRMYAYWLPDRLTPFLAAWQPPNATLFWDPDIGFTTRLNSFFRTFRFHFLALVAVLATWIMWPKRSSWKSSSDHRGAVFLSLLFVALFGLHFWATMSKNYCAYCLEGYTAFFAALGWMLLVLLVINFPREVAGWRQLLAVVGIVLITTGVGFSTFEDIGRAILSLEFPSLGLPSIAVLLENKFQLTPQRGQFIVASAAGLTAGILILALAAVPTWIEHRRTGRSRYGVWALCSLLVAGVLLTPTSVLGQGYRSFDCGGDVIASYQAAGEHLARLIPPGSQVYWKGGLSIAPLLYVPGINVLPSQVNGDYSYRRDGDPDALEKYGFWNHRLADQWLDEADYVLVEERYYRKWFKDWVDQDRFIELPPTADLLACRDSSAIRVFQRIR